MEEEKKVTIEAADAMGKSINASHGIVEEEIAAITPTHEGKHSAAVLKGSGVMLQLLQAAHEVRHELGWDQD